MDPTFKTINLGGVNCYLAQTGDGFILIDTGMAFKRTQLKNELDRMGCQPGNLNLIILTHGDTDHAENCVYLRDTYGAKIAMHPLDSGMVEFGDMSLSRKPKADKVSFFGQLIIRIGGLLVKSAKFETFKPDFYVEEGFDLNRVGFDAKVIHLPGHSKGSIGILTADGDLICGDLFWNLSKPKPHFMINNAADFKASVEKLNNLKDKYTLPRPWQTFPD